MKSFNIFYRNKNYKEYKRIRKILEKNNFKYSEEKIDLLFIIGGDGTFLHGCHKFKVYENNIHVIGIKTSKIGNFLLFKEEKLKELIEKIKNNNFNIIKLPLLEIKIKKTKYYIINDISLINPIRSLKLYIYVNNKLLGYFGSSGIVISTTSGSTGFNKSLGGPIFCKWTKNYILTPIAPISNNKFNRFNNSIVFSNNDIVEIKCDFSYTETGIDGHKINGLLSDFFISLSKKNIKLINIYNKDELLKRNI